MGLLMEEDVVLAYPWARSGSIETIGNTQPVMVFSLRG